LVADAFHFSPVELEGVEGVELDTPRSPPCPVSAAEWRRHVLQSRIFRALDQGSGDLVSLTSTGPDGAFVCTMNGGLEREVMSNAKLDSLQERQALLCVHILQRSVRVSATPLRSGLT
jgi:hypothetical protein